MRKKMPTIAQIVDQFRDLMADGGKVIYAEENGHVIDRREPEPNVYQLEASRFIARPAQPTKKGR